MQSRTGPSRAVTILPFWRSVRPRVARAGHTDKLFAWADDLPASEARRQSLASAKIVHPLHQASTVSAQSNLFFGATLPTAAGQKSRSGSPARTATTQGCSTLIERLCMRG